MIKWCRCWNGLVIVFHVLCLCRKWNLALGTVQLRQLAYQQPPVQWLLVQWNESLQLRRTSHRQLMSSRQLPVSLCCYVPGLVFLCLLYNSYHHQCHAAGCGRCFALTAWPWQMAHLQSSTGELLESRWIWSVHRMRGLPGRRLQLGPGGWPTDKSMCLWSAICTGTSLSSRAVCPKTEMRRAARFSPNGVTPVHADNNNSCWAACSRLADKLIFILRFQIHSQIVLRCNLLQIIKS